MPYIKKLVTCFDCNTKYFEMVLNGAVDKFVFKCSSCSKDGMPTFWRIEKQ